MNRLSLSAQTLYSELLQQTLAVEAARDMGSLPGAVVTKTVRGRIYYYLQYRDLNQDIRQVYIGPDSDAVRKLVSDFKAKRALAHSGKDSIEKLCSALRGAGAISASPLHYRVIKAFSDAGLFREGAVVVGTHAFMAIGNMLGVNWTSLSATQDIDLANQGMYLAVPPSAAVADDVLNRLNMGFIPITELDPRKPSTSFMMRGKELRVDFLVPLIGKETSKPVFVKGFNTAATPLRFLDYLIEEPVQAVVIGRQSALVNVPQPARFALHKILVHSLRPPAFQAKALKDVMQAGEVLEVLFEDRPNDVKIAWNDLKNRGTGWAKRVLDGCKTLQRNMSEVGAALRKVIEG